MSIMTKARVAESHIQSVRSFNRFYTRQIGLLNEGVYHSPFSLTDVRVLYELAHRSQPAAAELGKELGLDAGYLSRILGRFQKLGLISRTASKSDGRRSLLSLTARGRKVFDSLDSRSSDEVATMLGQLAEADQKRLTHAMHQIQYLLGNPAVGQGPYLLRSHRPGDMGWVVHRHGVLYSQEYGWDERFEALVAEIAARFVQNFDPKRERCWIAERDSEIVGSVFLVKETNDIARLRLLLVEPKARGLGLGKRLVEECVDFARRAGYKKITLWTQSVLSAARHVYQQAGFTLVHEEPHSEFGYPLVSETWELKL
jgi:DNA-binding MarR family transcriptional regulator/GNAT superfamily N-acetyltransferase